MTPTLLKKATDHLKPLDTPIRKLLFLAIISLFCVNTVNAQLAGNYTCTQHQIASQSPFTDYVVLSGSKTVLQAPAWDDQTPSSINLAGLSFVFKFNGTSQTTVYVSPNGYVTFGAAPATNNYTPFSTIGTTTGDIAVYAGNLKSEDLTDLQSLLERFIRLPDENSIAEEEYPVTNGTRIELVGLDKELDDLLNNFDELSNYLQNVVQFNFNEKFFFVLKDLGRWFLNKKEEPKQSEAAANTQSTNSLTQKVSTKNAKRSFDKFDLKMKMKNV